MFTGTLHLCLSLQVFLPGWGGHVYGGGPALGRRPALSPTTERPLFRKHCQILRLWAGPGLGVPPQQAHYSPVSFLSIYSVSSNQACAEVWATLDTWFTPDTTVYIALQMLVVVKCGSFAALVSHLIKWSVFRQQRLHWCQQQHLAQAHMALSQFQRCFGGDSLAWRYYS